MFAYAHVGDGHRMPLEHFLAWSIQGPKVPEALTAWRGLLRSGDHQDGQIGLGFEIYVKIICSKQILTS